MTDPVLINGAIEEPLSLTEAKAHCRITWDNEDTLVSDWIAAAREYVEGMTGRALITSTWDYYLDAFPFGSDIKMPKGRLQLVSSIKYTNSDGVEATFDPMYYHALTAREPGVVRLAHGASWPAVTLRSGDGVVIRFVCGYANAAAVPQCFKNAMKLLIGWWNENREAASLGNSASAVSTPIAYGVERILDAAPKFWY